MFDCFVLLLLIFLFLSKKNNICYSQSVSISFVMLIFLVFLTYCKICDRIKGQKDTDLASLNDVMISECETIV